MVTFLGRRISANATSLPGVTVLTGGKYGWQYGVKKGTIFTLNGKWFMCSSVDDGVATARPIKPITG